MKVTKTFVFVECCFVLAIISKLGLTFLYPIDWIIWFLLFLGGWIAFIIDWRIKKRD